MIGAVVLAAGCSTRMGQPKQLININGKPMVRHVVETILKSRVNEVVVVVGYKAQQVKAALSSLPVKIVINKDYCQGQGTSLACGVRALSPSTKFFLACIADQPFLTTDLINSLITAFQGTSALVLRPICRGTPGHPVVFSYSLSPQLELLREDQAANKLVRSLGEQVVQYPVDDKAAIFDVDTPLDLKRFCETKIDRN